jgi:hypothetical protein
MTQTQRQSERPIHSIFEILDRVLDKGIVIEATVSTALLGIEMIVIRARIVAASINTFLRYAGASGLTMSPLFQMPQEQRKVA